MEVKSKVFDIASCGLHEKPLRNTGDRYMAVALLIEGENLGVTRGGGQKVQQKKEWVRPLWFLFSVGWYVALSLAIPSGIGLWLDRPENLNKKPLFTLIGFGIGTVVAFYGLYRMLRQFYLEQQKLEKSRNKDAAK